MSDSGGFAVEPASARFVRDGRGAFLLADTVWGAFSRAEPDEWAAFLRLRRRQGFNAVCLSVLPLMHDRSVGQDDRMPFAVDDAGVVDFAAPRREYFERARGLAAQAVSAGLTPILVMLWCNYVPGSWAAARAPGAVMSREQMIEYLDLSLRAFSGLDVIWCVGGDDPLVDPLAIEWYEAAARRIRAVAPAALVTTHGSPDARPATAPGLHAGLDFFSFQSGHGGTWRERAELMPAPYLELRPRRPIVNLEPCYEAHGYDAGAERHTAADVRRASWSSVLAGAGAGLGYGAHGVWSWHRAGDRFSNEPFSGLPLPVDRAAELPGAWDVGFLRELVERHELFELAPAQELISAGGPGARVGRSPDGATLAVFLPHASSLELVGRWDRHELRVWSLAARRRDHVSRRLVAGATRFEQPDEEGDYLYLLTPRPEEPGGGGTPNVEGTKP